MSKIEKNVPIPPISRGRKPIYPFAEMSIGDSVLFEGKSVNQMNSAYQSYRKIHPHIKLTIRKTKEGTRVWRIE